VHLSGGRDPRRSELGLNTLIYDLPHTVPTRPTRRSSVIARSAGLPCHQSSLKLPTPRKRMRPARPGPMALILLQVNPSHRPTCRGHFRVILCAGNPLTGLWQLALGQLGFCRRCRKLVTTKTAGQPGSHQSSAGLPGASWAPVINAVAGLVVSVQ
jgi:hypothetical protein